jgi:hypothetical protein
MAVRRGLSIREDIKRIVDQTIPVDTSVEDFILPAIPVTQTGGTIHLTTAHAGHEVTDNRRSKEGSFVKGSFRYTKDTFETEMYGNVAELDNVQTLEVRQAYSFDEETFAGRLATEWMRTARKIRVKEALMEADYAGIGHEIEVTNKWDTAILSNMMATVATVKDKFLTRHGVQSGNIIFGCTENDFDKIIMELVEQDTMKYNESILTKSYDEQRNIVRQVMKVGGVLILDGVVSGAKDFFEEQADFVRVYDNNEGLFFIPSKKGTSWESPGIGRQPIWTPYAKDYRIDTWDDEETMKHNVRASEYRGVKVNTSYGIKVKDMFTV